MTIKIKTSKSADTRSCDSSSVTKEELLKNSKQHIDDVKQGMEFLSALVLLAGKNHDHTKISMIDDFHKDFVEGFKEGNTTWWEAHQKIERHHLKKEEFIQEDVNLVDILEQIVDGVMAGLARSGEYRQEPMSPDLLMKAYNNTVKLMLKSVEVEK